MTQEIKDTAVTASDTLELELAHAMENLCSCPHCPGGLDEDDTKIHFACGECHMAQLVAVVRRQIAAETLRAEAERPARVATGGVWTDHPTWKFYPPEFRRELLNRATAIEAQSSAEFADTMKNLDSCVHGGAIEGWVMAACSECHAPELIEAVRHPIAVETLIAESASFANSLQLRRCLWERVHTI